MSRHLRFSPSARLARPSWGLHLLALEGRSGLSWQPGVVWGGGPT